MESPGVVRTLAEPNLTAISGESATFISGGGFPIPTGVTCQSTTGGAIGQCVQTVASEIRHLAQFHPVVLTEGRISLRVMTEVSEISTENALTGGQGGTTHSFDQDRRAETTLEIPSGGSIAMAGSSRNRTSRPSTDSPASTRCRFRPALQEPGFINNQTELMVIVTPYVVRAVSKKELSRPDSGFAPASDAERHCSPRSTELRHPRHSQPIGNYRGDFRFIIDRGGTTRTER